MTGRADAIALVAVIATFAAGVGVGAILNGIAHAAEIAGLRRTIAGLRATADRVGPEPRRPLSPHHLHVPPSREAASHMAAAERRRGSTST